MHCKYHIYSFLFDDLKLDRDNLKIGDLILQFFFFYPLLLQGIESSGDLCARESRGNDAGGATIDLQLAESVQEFPEVDSEGIIQGSLRRCQRQFSNGEFNILLLNFSFRFIISSNC